MAARGMAIKPAGLQLSDALVRKARLARCRGIASWGLEHGGVIENPTSSFPRCRSALIARNCVRASWNFLSLSLSLPFSFLFVRFLSRIWICVLLISLSRERGWKRKEIPLLPNPFQRSFRELLKQLIEGEDKCFEGCVYLFVSPVCVSREGMK